MNTTTKVTVEYGILGYHIEKQKWIKAPTTWKGYDDEEEAKKFFKEFLDLWVYKVDCRFVSKPEQWKEFKLVKRTVITSVEEWQGV